MNEIQYQNDLLYQARVRLIYQAEVQLIAAHIIHFGYFQEYGHDRAPNLKKIELRVAKEFGYVK